MCALSPDAAEARAGATTAVATVVRLDAVAKTYPNGTRALLPVTLDVHDGDFVTLLGPSGCGKSTLLNLMAGLIAPSSGALSWWGEKSRRSGREGQRLAFVFQAPTLMPWARLGRNVRLPLDLAGVPRHESNRKVMNALRGVGLARFSQCFPRELSGGMQMRASIARALVTDPDLILMDEPFGALDEFARHRLDTELSALWSARRRTIVFVTHNIQEAVFLSTRVVVMAARPGRVVAEIAIDESVPRVEGFRQSAAFGDSARRVYELVAQTGADAIEND